MKQGSGRGIFRYVLVWLALIAVVAVPCEAADRLPLRLAEGVPLLRVDINGEGPFWFLLDTGTSAPFVVSEQLVKQLDLPTREHRSRADAGEQVIDVMQVATIKQMQIEGAQLPPDTEAAVLDLSALGRCRVGGAFVDGIVGVGFFRHAGWQVVVDYRNESLEVGPSTLGEPDGENILPMMHGEAGGVVAVPLTFDEQMTLVVVDTGASSGLGLGERLSESASVSELRPVGLVADAAGPNVREAGRVKGDLKIGQWIVRDPVAFSNRGDPFIGYEILRDFRVTFDFKQEAVRFEGPLEDGQAQVLEMPARHDLGLRWCIEGADDYSLEAVRVEEGRPAATAGLRQGDRVVRINGRSPKHLLRFGLADWQDWLRHVTDSRHARFDILRDGREMSLDLPVLRTVALGAEFALADPQWRVTVRTVFPETSAAEHGIRPGDRLEEIDGMPVRAGEAIARRFSEVKRGQVYRLTLSRDGEPYTVALPVETVIE